MLIRLKIAAVWFTRLMFAAARRDGRSRLTASFPRFRFSPLKCAGPLVVGGLLGVLVAEALRAADRVEPAPPSRAAAPEAAAARSEAEWLDAGREEFTRSRQRPRSEVTVLNGNFQGQFTLLSAAQPSTEPVRLFNAQSCSECHRQGGIGGGGPNENNVQSINVAAASNAFPVSLALSATGTDIASRARARWSQSFFPHAHDGSMILHRFGTDLRYAGWRAERLQAANPDHSAFSFDNVTLTPNRGSQGTLVLSSGGGTLQLASGIRMASVPGPVEERNTPALFGIGLIDAIPSAVIDAVAAAQPPEVRGRSPMLPDGRRGRFGWKCQTATLAEFNENACAVELGLSTPRLPPTTVDLDAEPWPGRRYYEVVNEVNSQLSGQLGGQFNGQAVAFSGLTPLSVLDLNDIIPNPKPLQLKPLMPGFRMDSRQALARLELDELHRKVLEELRKQPAENESARTPPTEQAAGGDRAAADKGPSDMTAVDLAELTRFIAALPAPQPFVGPSQRADVLAGRELFTSTRCAECHTPSLGGVALYSDLLLHDIGTIGSGGYTGRSSTPALVNSQAPQSKEQSPVRPATATEFRTPPLWGVADSGPYLHDGSAATLEAAIFRHTNQAAPSVMIYARLPDKQRGQVLTFLESLRAP
jgi:CxxC motif-containing protein (DUF1111 family)